MNERIVKVILVSISSVRGYNRWVWRAVECQPNQRGYRTERGVKVLWESYPLYRPTASRGKGPAARAKAKQVAAEHFVALNPTALTIA